MNTQHKLGWVRRHETFLILFAVVVLLMLPFMGWQNSQNPQQFTDYTVAKYVAYFLGLMFAALLTTIVLNEIPQFGRWFRKLFNLKDRAER